VTRVQLVGGTVDVSQANGPDTKERKAVAGSPVGVRGGDAPALPPPLPKAVTPTTVSSAKTTRASMVTDLPRTMIVLSSVIRNRWLSFNVLIACSGHHRLELLA
jgi:hypothetical protein